MAEYEGRLISERTKAGLAAAKVRGIKLGAPRNFTADERARAAIAAAESHRRRASKDYADLLPLVRNLRTAGETMSGVARALNAAERRTRSGGPWSIASVRRFLLREGWPISLPARFIRGFRDEDNMRAARESAAAALRQAMVLAYASVVPQIVASHSARLTFATIARQLNADGKVTRLGKAWTSQDVRRLLQREGVIVPGISRAAVDVTQLRLNAVVALAARRSISLKYRQRVLPIAKQCRSRGLTYKAIAKEFNRRRIRTIRGNLWDASMIWILLNRPVWV
jgi:hypothetical protein